MRKYIIGIDEVGRGPLAGPITVAAIGAPISNSKFLISKHLRGIKDSKRLSEKQREEWFKKLIAHPKIVYAHTSVGNATIDKKGISYAARLAIKRVLKKLGESYHLPRSRQGEAEGRPVTNYKIFLDGSLYAPPEYIHQKTIIRGDQKVPLIAAASIIAKVTRDRKMKRLAKKYPAYGFDIHKGYGTLLHRNSIKTHGLCEIHRASFCKNLIFSK